MSDAFSVATTGALEFLSTQTDYVEIPLTIDTTVDFYIDIRWKAVALSVSDLAGHGSADVEKVQIAGGGPDGKPYFLIGSTGAYAGSNGDFVIGTYYTHRIKYTWTGSVGQMSRYQTTNDQIVEGTDLIGSPLSVSGLSNGVCNFYVGKGKGLPTFNGDVIVDWVDMNGIKYDFNAIVGGQVLDTLGGNAKTIITDRADVNDMLVTV